MAVMLPAEVSGLLNMLGFEWPEGNEDTVLGYGQRWTAYGADVTARVQGADAAAGYALSTNEGAAMDAFRGAFTQSDGVRDVAGLLSTGGSVLGGCLYVVGAAIIALKVAFVVNLVATAIQIAAAIAAAIPSAGTSLAWIPVAKILCSKLLDMAINVAITTLLGGV